MNDVIEAEPAGGAVFVMAERCLAGEGTWHTDARARLVGARDRVLTVRTEAGMWVAPPKCAVWVPAGVLHRVSCGNDAAVRTLYIDGAAAPVPEQCCVVSVDPLTDALLTAACEFGADYPPEGPQARIVGVILDQLPRLAPVPLALNWPKDLRAQHIANLLLANPARPDVLDDLAEDASITARTAARLFSRETGQTFGQWRQQLRLLCALARLGHGASVTQVALEVGYNDVSSFIAVFRQALGETPARYFR
ncbi:AraC family transcriptional regulator [Paraburkholderia saeva]|uniref:AraC family transcriptional regulator n=1 Tax=Paraburkholderia saeva TaxID=2777537 RepID=UPI001DA88228|nr:helix-turn-helix transcriptional regulator [Paraburkholderia saeva]CAG4926166.1 HTH-type transcriptional regulator NimR [Paraburkholderia saeva]